MNEKSRVIFSNVSTSFRCVKQHEIHWLLSLSRTNMDAGNATPQQGHMTSHPVIIGNVNAANLLSSSMVNSSPNLLLPANVLGLPSTVNNNQVIGILPVFIQGPPPTASNHDVMNSNANAEFSQTLQPGVTKGLNGDDVSVSNVNTFCQELIHLHSSAQQAKLTSSDTIILPSSSSNLISSDTIALSTSSSNLISSDTIPLSTSSSATKLIDPKTSVLHSLLKQDSSLLKTAFSFVSNVSNTSVNIENIPSFTLFKPNQGGEMQVVKELEADSSKQTQSDKCEKMVFDSCLHEQPANKVVVFDNSLARDEQSVSEDKQNGLKRNDTLILPMTSGLGNLQCKPQLSSSDTVLLTSTNSHHVNAPASHLENGSSGVFSVAMSDSMSLLQRPPFSSIPTLMLTNSLVDGTVNPSMLCNLISQPSENNNPLLKCLSLNQLLSNGNSNLLNESLQKLLEGSISSQLSSNVSSTVDAKGTQTDLVLGNASVYLKAVKMTEEQQNSVVEEKSPERNIQTCLFEDGLMNPAPAFESEEQAASSSFNISFPDQSVCGIEAATEKCNDEEVEDEVDNNPFHCVVCDKRFSSKGELKKHGKSHPQVLKCDLCTATFTRKGNYKRHRRIHDLRPERQNVFTCTVCGREFLQNCDLKRHLLIHTNQQPYRCDICDKGYIRRSDLVVHMRFHNKEKIFKCHLCPKTYFQKGDLTRHIRRSHEPGSQLTCGHCDRKYAGETTLIRHMKVVHKDIITSTVNEKLKPGPADKGKQG